MLSRHKSDEQRTGEIILMVPTMTMLEIVVFSQALDICLVEKLNMEGGRTGRRAVIRPSKIMARAA